MVKVLLADPALAALADRFAEHLPDDVDVYYSRRPVPSVDERFGAQRLALEEVLRRSNIVTLHVPLTPETHHLIGPAEIATMPPGSYLINAGRGGLVDEAALRDAIAGGHLAGAGLDVLEHETDGMNPFADVPEVIVTPHLGGGSRNSMNGVVERSTANIRRFLAGQEVADRIDLGEGSRVSRQSGS